MKNMLMKSALLVGTVAAGFVSVAPADASTFGFKNITGGAVVGDALSGDFSFEVTDQGSNTALFRLFNKSTNNSTQTPSIGQVAFDNRGGALTGITALNVNNVSPSGVSFELDNGNLPQGNNLAPTFNTDFGARFASGGSSRIDVGEVLGLRLGYTTTFQSILNNLANGGLRVGIHVQEIANSSDSYINQTTPIPTPALLPGLIALGAGILRKRNAEQMAEVETEA